MMSADHDIDGLKAAIIEKLPEHAHSRFTPITMGWDSIAMDVDGRMIFKFPRHAAARAALRREEALLAVIRPALINCNLPLLVPDLAIVSEDPMFSRHQKLQGSYLTTANYANLPTTARDRLAHTLAQFYHALHSLPVGPLKSAGAKEIEPWRSADAICAEAIPHLPAAFQAYAERSLRLWQALPPDPHGMTYGYFDGHGWNMAFDHETQTLNGLYDFADSGFGPLHQEFIASNLISPDLTARIVAAYEQKSSHRLDLDRITLLTTALRLSELAEVMQAADSTAELRAQVKSITIDWLTTIA